MSNWLNTFTVKHSAYEQQSMVTPGNLLPMKANSLLVTDRRANELPFCYGHKKSTLSMRPQGGCFDHIPLFLLKESLEICWEKGKQYHFYYMARLLAKNFMCTNGCLFVHPSTLPLQHYTTSIGSGIAGLLAKDFKYKRWVPVGKITRQKLQGYRWVPVYSPLYTSTAYYTTSNLCLVYAMQVYLQKDSKYKRRVPVYSPSTK